MATVIGKTSQRIDDLLELLVNDGEITNNRRLLLKARGGNILDLGALGPTQEEVEAIGQSVGVSAAQHAAGLISEAEAELNANMIAGEARAKAEALAGIAAAEAQLAINMAEGDAAVKAQVDAELAAAETALNENIVAGNAAVKSQVEATLAAETARIDSDINAVESSQSVADGRITTALENAASASAAAAAAPQIGRGLAVEDLKTLWGTGPNNTLIDGGKLFTNTVFARSVALGDFTNLHGDRYFNILPTSFFPFGVGHPVVTTASPPAGGNAVRLTGRDHFADSNLSPMFDCKPDDEFFASVTFKYETSTLATDPIRVGLYLRKADSSSTAQPWYGGQTSTVVGNDVNLGNGWFRRSWTIKAVNAASYPDLAKASIWINVDQTAGSGVAKVLISDLVFMRRAGGELIVDGGITAIKLDADAINGKTITGALFRTTDAPNRGIKIVSSDNGAFGSLIAYDGSAGSNATFSLNGQTGAVTIRGDLGVAAAITGATITGGTIQTKETGDNIRAIRLSGNQFLAFNEFGFPMFAIDGEAGTVTANGPIVSGGTITGGTFQTQPTGTNAKAIRISGNILTAYNGSSQPMLTINGETGTIAMNGEVAAGMTITGGVIRTAASGQRVELSSNSASTITFHTDYPGSAGIIQVDGKSATNSYLYVVAPRMQGVGGSTPRIDMQHSTQWPNGLMVLSAEYVKVTNELQVSGPITSGSRVYGAIELSYLSLVGSWTGSGHFRREGKFVMGTLDITASAYKANDSLIGTIPSGYFPPSTTYVVLTNADTGTSKTCYLNSAGQLFVLLAMGAGERFVGSFTYLTNQ